MRYDSKGYNSAPNRPVTQMSVRKQTFLSIAQSIFFVQLNYAEHNLNIQLINLRILG